MEEETEVSENVIFLSEDSGGSGRVENVESDSEETADTKSSKSTSATDNEEALQRKGGLSDVEERPTKKLERRKPIERTHSDVEQLSKKNRPIEGREEATDRIIHRRRVIRDPGRHADEFLKDMDSKMMRRFGKKEPELPRKEGELLKKSSTSLAGWQKRWLRVENKQLLYFRSRTAAHPSGCIDFDLVKCTIECLWSPSKFGQSVSHQFSGSAVSEFTPQNGRLMDILGCCCCGARRKPPPETYGEMTKEKDAELYCEEVRFRIKPVGARRVFEFSGPYHEAWEWVRCISKHISVSTQIADPLMVATEKRFWEVSRIAPYKFNEIADTGDVVLFKSKQPLSKVQRLMTGGRYDHVGMVMRKVDGRIYLLEALGRVGVIVTSWEEFMEKDWHKGYKKIAVRRLHFTRTSACLRGLLEFCWQNVGKPYGLSVEKLFRADSMGGEPPDFFCSELVAQAWKSMGVLNKEHVVSTQVWPGNFAQDAVAPLPFEKGCSLSSELMIDFRLPKNPPLQSPNH